MDQAIVNSVTKNLVFIASGGRTGTQFFGEKLQDVIADCWSEHEPDMIAGFSTSTIFRIRRFGVKHMLFDRFFGRSGIRVIGFKLLSGRISRTEAADLLKKMRRKYHDSISESLIIESYFRWWMCAECIPLAWPNAKLVGIIRDPRDWIASWLRHSPTIHSRGWLHWFPTGPLTPSHVQDNDWMKRWGTLSTVGKLAWDWRTVYGHLDRVKFGNENVGIFRFEDLFGRKQEALNDLLRFITNVGGHSYQITVSKGFTDSVINASAGDSYCWKSWPSVDIRLIDELCGPLMRKYGYGMESGWLSKL